MFETKRLLLRKFQDSDVREVFAMRKDPLVMRFIREPQTDIESTIAWIKMMSASWDRFDFGFCALIERTSGDFLGWCGLWELKETGEIEVGYAIKPSRWGRGFATEAAELFLEYGFEVLGFESIVAVAYEENIGSKRVMEKLGMEFVGLGTFYGVELAKFSINQETWYKIKK